MTDIEHLAVSQPFLGQKSAASLAEDYSPRMSKMRISLAIGQD
jgi:hypothetical protein